MANEKKEGSDKNFEEHLKKDYSSEKKKERPSPIQGIPFFSWFFNRLGWLLSKLSRWIFILFFAILFVLFLIFLYNYFYGAQQYAVVYEHAKTTFLDVVTPAFVKAGFGGVLSAVFNPSEYLAAGYGFESDIEKNKDNQDLGLKIADLKQEGGVTYSGQPIFLRGTIKAQSLDRPLTATISCSLDDYKEAPQISLPVSGQGNKIEIYKDIPQTYSVGCYFANGINIEELSNLISLDKTKVIPRISKEAKMIVDYNFVTKASHNTYFLNGQLASDLLARGLDPFVYYGIKDPQLKADRTVTSKATVGPVNLGIGTYDSQPFSEDTPYFFGVSLSNNINFNGYIKELNNLQIHLPPNMVVSGESGFEEGTVCDFYYTGDTDENGFKVYALKDEKREEVNKRCTMTEIKERKIGFDDCISLFKSNFNYICQFKIIEPIIGDSMYIDFIRAEADYKYETTKRLAVDIIATPGMS